MRKKSGEVHQFLIQMIGIIISFAILLYAIFFFRTIISYNNVNQVARKYILKMERNGYISDKDKNEIVNELTTDDIEEVNVNSNAEGKDNKVKYGEEVRLTITCKIKQKTIDFSDFSFEKSDKKHEITITKASTAKY